MRGSVVYTPSTSVRIWHSSAPSTTASATAVVSEPPRPMVVMSPFAARPWNPATTGTTPAARSALRPSQPTRSMRARPAGPVVSIGSCSAFQERARQPDLQSAIARSAVETISPVASSASISRASGSGLTSRASSIRRSVESPIAETTTATWWPCAASARTCAATAWMRATEPTEVPPYFWTISMRARLFQVSAGICRAVADFRRSIENSAETSARLGRRPISSLYVRS